VSPRHARRPNRGLAALSLTSTVRTQPPAAVGGSPCFAVRFLAAPRPAPMHIVTTPQFSVRHRPSRRTALAARARLARTDGPLRSSRSRHCTYPGQCRGCLGSRAIGSRTPRRAPTGRCRRERPSALLGESEAAFFADLRGLHRSERAPDGALANRGGSELCGLTSPGRARRSSEGLPKEAANERNEGQGCCPRRCPGRRGHAASSDADQSRDGRSNRDRS